MKPMHLYVTESSRRQRDIILTKWFIENVRLVEDNTMYKLEYIDDIINAVFSLDEINI